MRREQIIFPILRAATKRDWAMAAVDKVLRPWNPFSPKRYSDPYPLYEQVRAHGPVLYQRPLRTWFVTGYAEAEEVLRASATTVDRADLVSSIAPYSKLAPETIGLFTGTMLMTDPPDHTRLRRLVNRAFTPRAIAGLEPRIEKICLDLLHQLGEHSHADAMAMFADQLPIFVISDMLGLPRTDWDRFKVISDEMVRFVDPISGFRPTEMTHAVDEFNGMLDILMAERRRQPQDDMLTRLVDAEDDGDRLSTNELRSMVAILMVAGHETTAGLLGNSLLALDAHPDARRQLIEHPALAANAVEELLRFDSPVQGTDRVATATIQVGDHTIDEGEMVVVLLGGANRDPRRFEEPNELRLDRDDPRPLSFGHGIHHCLGAALARLEATVALPLFLDTFPDYRVDRDNVDWKRSVTVRGPRSLPIAL